MIKGRIVESLIQELFLSMGYNVYRYGMENTIPAIIKCITINELKEGKAITPTSTKYLGNRKEFELDRNAIIDFCKFATQFFEAV